MCCSDMVIANKDDANGCDLLEIHRTILKARQGVVCGLDDQPKPPGKLKGVLTSTVSCECVKTPRECWGNRQNLSGIQIR